MSYLTFHLLFVLPPILLLATTQPQPLAGKGGSRARYTLPLISGIALVYTAAWDNYLVARSVWWYGPERVLATLGFVPVEEYLFFLLQPLFTGLFLYQYLARHAALRRIAGPVAARTGGALFGALAAVGGILLLSSWPRGLYLGLILVWACPVLAGMWLYAGPTLWQFRHPLIVGTLIPTCYLWIADAIAIHLGIWEISTEYSLGVRPFGFPIEEAVFFLLTNLLVVQGILLFLFPPNASAGNVYARDAA